MSQTVIDRLAELTRPTGEEDILDIDFSKEKPRLDISPRTALVAGIVVAFIAIVVVGYSLLSTPRSLEAPPSGESLAAPNQLIPGPLGEKSQETEIVVSVVGAVERPGLVTLPAGSRIADALEASGGVVEGANSFALNLAQLLVDGQQIVVPAMADPGEQNLVLAGVDASGKVSLNSAEASQLITLDGVGEATAQAIIDYRQDIGGFSSIEQLLDVSGIGPAKFAKLKDHVTL